MKTILTAFKRKGQGRQAVISAAARKRRIEERQGRGQAILVKTASTEASWVSQPYGREEAVTK